MNMKSTLKTMFFIGLVSRALGGGSSKKKNDEKFPLPEDNIAKENCETLKKVWSDFEKSDNSKYCAAVRKFNNDPANFKICVNHIKKEESLKDIDVAKEKYNELIDRCNIAPPADIPQLPSDIAQPDSSTSLEEPLSQQIATVQQQIVTAQQQIVESQQHAETPEQQEQIANPQQQLNALQQETAALQQPLPSTPELPDPEPRAQTDEPNQEQPEDQPDTVQSQRERNALMDKHLDGLYRSFQYTW